MKKNASRIKALLLGCICAVTTALSAVPVSAATVVAGASSATNDPALTAAPGTYTADRRSFSRQAVCTANRVDRGRLYSSCI